MKPSDEIALPKGVYTDLEKRLLILPGMKEVIDFLHNHPGVKKSDLRIEDKAHDKIKSTYSAKLSLLVDGGFATYEKIKAVNTKNNGGRPSLSYRLTEKGEAFWAKIFGKTENFPVPASIDAVKDIKNPMKAEIKPEAKPEPEPEQTQSEPEQIQNEPQKFDIKDLMELYNAFENVKNTLNSLKNTCEYCKTHYEPIKANLDKLVEIGQKMNIKNITKFKDIIEETCNDMNDSLKKLLRISVEISKLDMDIVGSVNIKMKQ